MGYKMKGSPAKLGSIQGTTGHASALKMASSPAPFIGSVIGAVGKAAGAVSKITGGAGKIGKMASNVAAGAEKAGNVVKKGKEYLSKRKAKKAEKKKMYDVGGDSAPAKMYGKKSPAKMYGKKSPTKVALKGKQNNLPEDLKAKIIASPGKMKTDPKKGASKGMSKKLSNLTPAQKKVMKKKMGPKDRPEPTYEGTDEYRKEKNIPSKEFKKRGVKKKAPSKWIGTAIKVVGKGLAGRAASQQARDSAKNKGVQDALGRGRSVTPY
tara:strand:- start:43 stop:840 length:798 start_codon:yes stop_codon:yes gene_type:complete